MTIKEIYDKGRRLLSPVASSGCNADFEAKCLLQHFTGCVPAMLPIEGSRPITENELDLFLKAVQKRLEGYPLQYILGQWEFYGLTFRVGEGVLIPRPETELLVDTVLELAGKAKCLKILDICSGSGCIAVAIAAKRPNWDLWALELSEKAFSYLTDNIKLNSTSNLTGVIGDALMPPEAVTSQKYDFIVSNPPYISEREKDSLQQEVKKEPHMALFAGEEGLYFYRRLPLIYKDILNPGGRIIFEIGHNQGDAVADILRTSGFINVEIKKDYEGRDRVVLGVLPH